MQRYTELLEREAGHVLVMLLVFILLIVLWYFDARPMLERLIDTFAGALLYAMTAKTKTKETTTPPTP